MQWTRLMDRLSEQTYSYTEEKFIMGYRQTLATQAMLQNPPSVRHCWLKYNVVIML